MKPIDKKETLLIVDDIPSNVTLLLDFLTRAGYEVLVAEDGEEGVQTAEYARPDLILLDIMMPGMNGFEACQYLKSQSQTADIPIIFMTALTDTTDKVKGFSLGAADYITKPIQFEEVLARITTHLKLRRLQKQLTAQNKQLQEHTEELEIRNRELDAFAHTVAHDLKNPLHAVISLTDILQQKFAITLPEKAQKHLEIIALSGHKMTKIIDALLLLARLSKQEVKTVPLDMGEVVEQVQQRLHYMNKQYTGTIVFPDTWLSAYGYPQWVEEIWVNYIGNALKYSGNPPHIEVGNDECKNGMIKFWVRDNGEHLAPEVYQQLFTPFTRLQESHPEGYGLGLSIVQRITEKLGGEVGVRTIEGNGNEFYFTLPINAHLSDMKDDDKKIISSCNDI